jgi:hypothetical protein
LALAEMDGGSCRELLEGRAHRRSLVPRLALGMTKLGMTKFRAVAHLGVVGGGRTESKKLIWTSLTLSGPLRITWGRTDRKISLLGLTDCVNVPSALFLSNPANSFVSLHAHKAYQATPEPSRETCGLP